MGFAASGKGIALFSKADLISAENWIYPNVRKVCIHPNDSRALAVKHGKYLGEHFDRTYQISLTASLFCFMVPPRTL